MWRVVIRPDKDKKRDEEGMARHAAGRGGDSGIDIPRGGYECPHTHRGQHRFLSESALGSLGRFCFPEEKTQHIQELCISLCVGT